jgi:hypothetical protein
MRRTRNELGWVVVNDANAALGPVYLSQVGLVMDVDAAAFFTDRHKAKGFLTERAVVTKDRDPGWRIVPVRRERKGR